MPLHPDHVRVERDANGQKRYRLPSGEPIPRADILHVRLFPQAGLDVSPSPIQVARETIGLGLAAQAFGARWFGEGAAPSSMLTTDQPLSDTQVKQLKSEWIATHGGRRQPAILAGGLKWEPITITPEESQFLETRKFQRAEIASLFRVPPHMIGDLDRTTSWGTGIEQQSIGFVVHTLRPYLERIEGALTRLLPGQQFVKFNVDGLLRGDTPARYTAYQQALDGGWMNPDEVRALEDRPPIPGGAGKKYRQPLNYGPLGYDPTSQPAPAAACFRSIGVACFRGSERGGPASLGLPPGQDDSLRPPKEDPVTIPQLDRERFLGIREDRREVALHEAEIRSEGANEAVVTGYASLFEDPYDVFGGPNRSGAGPRSSTAGPSGPPWPQPRRRPRVEPRQDRHPARPHHRRHAASCRPTRRAS
jgi:HK97 family phage portal protein